MIGSLILRRQSAITLANTNHLLLGMPKFSSKKPAKGPIETNSFIMNMSAGRLCTKELLPFPQVLSAEKLDALGQMLDPVEKFLETENDPYKNDETETFNPKTIDGLKELGAFGLQVPEDFGGIGLSNTEYARVVSIVGLTDLALGIMLGSHQSIGYKGILLYGTPEQKKKYLPDLASGKKLAAYCLTEPGHGSDASSIESKAVLSPDGKHYTLNGTKVWISNGGWAEVFTVFAKVPQKDEATGQMKDRMTGFIVERGFGGVKHSAPEKKMGIKASNTVSLYFEDCKVPVENVLGEVGQGFKVAVNILNQGRFGMASALSGTMKTAIKKAIDHATQRKQFGRHLIEFKSVQEKLAAMMWRQYATEAMAFMISGIMDQGAKDFQLEAAASKVYSSESAWFCVDEAIQIHGGMGFMRETQLERVLRDLRVFRIFEGANDVLRLFIGLTAMQHAGRCLQANPSGQASALIVQRFKQKLGMGSSGSTLSGQITSPELRDSAKMLGDCVDMLSWLVFELLKKHTKTIIEQQLEVTRVADATVNIYAAACALSRAELAHKSGLEKNELDLQNNLVRMACYHAHQLTSRISNEIMTDSFNSNFAKPASQVAHLLAKENIFPKSPIGV